YATPMPAAAAAKAQNTRRMSPGQIEAQGRAATEASTAANEAWLQTLKTRAAPLEAQLLAHQNGSLKEARAAALEEAQSGLPFRQQYPGITRTIQGFGEFGPAAIAWRTGYTTRRNIQQAIRDYETAVRTQDPVGVARAQQLLSDYTGGTWGDWGKHK